MNQRWIVRYRRYGSEPWSERAFTSETEARTFAGSKYSPEQADAQVAVSWFVDPSALAAELLKVFDEILDSQPAALSMKRRIERAQRAKLAELKVEVKE